jgi:hypothetical protein
LATQNPVDLDYKALSNAGTWFIGRLQTERDKARLLDGLDSAAAGGGKFDRKQVEGILSSLGSRVFLMNNTHEDAPEIFQTRWALSYLRGPLTRDQIKTLMDPIKAAVPAPSGSSPSSPPVSLSASVSQAAAGQPPALAPDISQFFIPVRGGPPSGSKLIYTPGIVGAAKVNFLDSKSKIDTVKNVVYAVPVTDGAIPVVWENASEVDVPANDLEKTPAKDAIFAALPSAASISKNYSGWEKDFDTWLYGSQHIDLLQSPSLKQVSNPGEDERDFRIRLQQFAREQRDEMVEDLRKKYAPKIATLKERLRKAEQAVEKQTEQAKKAKINTAISIGSTILGAFTGRKVISQASTAMRGVTRAMDESKDVSRAGETVEAIQKQLADLQTEFDSETAASSEKIDPLSETLETLTIKPKKADISIQLVSLVWTPYWQDAQGEQTPAW